MKHIGVVGCGNISEVYFYNLTNRFSDVSIKACSDLDSERTAAVKKRYPEIAALSAGKHVYTEKPLALSIEDADNVLQLAADKHLYVGSSPDTVLGSGIQTCRKLIDARYGTLLCKCAGNTAWSGSRGCVYDRPGG
jgi:predicted dehydrogenase